MLELRPYQKKAISSITAEWDKGHLNTLTVIPTGGGKSATALALLKEHLEDGCRALWVAHRRELIYQPRDAALNHFPDLGHPGVVMGASNECASRVIIATIQTLASEGRVEQILENGPITHLITDEAHHAISDTYRSLYARLREANPELRHLGLTATPKRSDGDGLTAVFDCVAFRITIKDLIRDGYLVPLKAFAVSLPVTFDGVKENSSGWSDDEAGEILSRRNAEDLIISTWEKHAADRPTVGFCASVAQAYSLAKRFQDAGHVFEALDGTTPKNKRQAILRRFQNGKTQGVINCMVLTEGWDAPHASCLLQVRPTKSDLVYVQMVGRVLRISEGKENALILDFVPASARDMVMAGDVLGKPKEQRKREEAARQDGIIGAFGIDSEGEGIDGDPDEIIMTALNYFSSSRLGWYFQGSLATAAVGMGETLAIRMPDKNALDRLDKANEIRESGKWNPRWDAVYEQVREAGGYCLYRVYKEENRTKAAKLGLFTTWEDAADAADGVIGEKGISVLSNKEARWRKQQPSEKQIALLKKFGVYDALDSPTKGIAARAITHFFAEKALSR